ncbi:hypothetical protein EDC30_103224 [Paucimonas lemoignei]|uniref:Uncharacterized protein n=1 Tax=Paucimonas lemoignei TaxID=29443 RepID=A0A4R3HXM4_PAULE|nr:hypothetical protein EDC30_103224 [Paucimonas lemoignei]
MCTTGDNSSATTYAELHKLIGNSLVRVSGTHTAVLMWFFLN